MNIFQIHITKDNTPLPQALQHTTQILRQLHPQSAYQLFTEPILRDFIGTYYGRDVLAAFDKLKPFAFKADLARLCLIHHHGGLYVDLPILFLGPLHMHPDIRALLFRDINLMLPYGWGVVNGLFFAQAGSAFLLKGIDLILENCRHETYDSTPFAVSGPALFGRALAMSGDTEGHVVGDRMSLTPMHPKKNIAFVMPDGSVIAWAKNKGHGGDLTPYGETTGNNYMEMWKARDIYDTSIKR
jgi:hypothetical protein